METQTYTALLEYFKEDDKEGYGVYFPALPEIVTWGRTVEEAEENAKEALACHLEGLREAGLEIPSDIDTEEPVRISKISI